MRLVAILGSLRPNGNTARALSLLAEELVRPGERRRTAVELETVRLGELDLRPCRGCRACFDLGEEACPHRDDLPALYRRLREADGVVLATPVYVNDVSGTMKTLLDRLAAAARRLFEPVVGRRHERPSFVNLAMFRLQQSAWRKADPGSVDFAYWQRNGWFDRRRSFFLPHRAPRPRVLAARAAGALLARLFAG